MKKRLAAVFIFFFLGCTFSGCVWSLVAFTGAAVIGASVDEYEQSQVNATGVEELDSYLADQRRVDEAFSRENTEPMDIDEVIKANEDPIHSD